MVRDIVNVAMGERGVRVCVFVAFVCSAASALAVAPAPVRYDAVPRSVCGANCVYMLLSHFGRKVSYDDVLRSLQGGHREVDMATLQGVSRHYGLPTEVARCPLDALRDCPRPFIAHLRARAGESYRLDGHYVVVVSVDDNGLRCLDGTTAEAIHFTFPAFKTLWSGHLLVPLTDSHFGRLAGLNLLVWGCACAIWWLLRGSHATKAKAAAAICVAVCLTASIKHSIASTGGERVKASGWRTAANDGVNSLYVLLRTYGRSVDYSAVATMVHSEGSGTSLAGLQQAAARLGFRTKVCRWGPADCAAFGQPVIAHLESDTDHGQFAVVLHRGGPKYFVMPGGPATVDEMSADQFRRVWSGYVLVPRASPVPWLFSLGLTVVLIVLYMLRRWSSFRVQ